MSDKIGKNCNNCKFQLSCTEQYLSYSKYGMNDAIVHFAVEYCSIWEAMKTKKKTGRIINHGTQKTINPKK